MIYIHICTFLIHKVIPYNVWLYTLTVLNYNYVNYLSFLLFTSNQKWRRMNWFSSICRQLRVRIANYLITFTLAQRAPHRVGHTHTQYSYAVRTLPIYQLSFNQLSNANYHRQEIKEWQKKIQAFVVQWDNVSLYVIIVDPVLNWN